MRVGLGYCMHAFDPSRVLVLGGVKIPGAWGLRGPGDADVVLLALVDALLGAAALGDREDHFPAAEAPWCDAPGAVQVAEALAKLTAAGLAPGHVDVTLVAERPALRPHRAAMRERLASLLRLEASRVSVKATPTGAPGGPGAAEGILAMAIVGLQEASA